MFIFSSRSIKFFIITCVLATTLACSVSTYQRVDEEKMANTIVAQNVTPDVLLPEMVATRDAVYSKFNGEQVYNVTQPGGRTYNGDCQYAHDMSGTPILDRKYIPGENGNLDRIVLTDSKGSNEYTYAAPYIFCRFLPGRYNRELSYSECVYLRENSFSIVVNRYEDMLNLDERYACDRLDFVEAGTDELGIPDVDEESATTSESTSNVSDCIATPGEYIVEFRKDEQTGKDNRYNCLSFMTFTNKSRDDLWVHYYWVNVTINNPKSEYWMVQYVESSDRFEPRDDYDYQAYYMDHPSGIEYVDIGPMVVIRDTESCRGYTPENTDLSAYSVELDTFCPP